MNTIMTNILNAYFVPDSIINAHYLYSNPVIIIIPILQKEI